MHTYYLYLHEKKQKTLMFLHFYNGCCFLFCLLKFKCTDVDQIGFHSHNIKRHRFHNCENKHLLLPLKELKAKSTNNALDKKTKRNEVHCTHKNQIKAYLTFLSIKQKTENNKMNYMTPSKELVA